MSTESPLPPLDYAPPTAQTAEPAPMAEDRLRRIMSGGAFVGVMIAATVLMVAGAATIIYIHWLKTEFPTSYILLTSAPGEAPEGAEVSVAQYGHDLATVKLTAAEKFRAPVLVEPGEYTITARYAGLILVRKVVVPPRRTLTVVVPFTAGHGPMNSTTEPERTPPPP